MAGSRLHAHAKQMKEQLVAAHGVQDLAPFMVVLTEDGETFFGHPGDELEAGLAEGIRMGEILAASVMSLRIKNSMVKIQRMMMCVEGYSKSINSIGRSRDEAFEEIRDIAHGDLAADFADNPDSDVSEVLMTNIWNVEDDHIVFQLWCTPFRYTDGCIVVWGEDMGPLGDETEGGINGAICDAGKAVMR